MRRWRWKLVSVGSVVLGVWDKKPSDAEIELACYQLRESGPTFLYKDGQDKAVYDVEVSYG